MSGHTLAYNHRHGTVDVTLSGVTILGLESSTGAEDGNESVTVGMALDAFNALVAGASEPRMREMRSTVKRLSDDRDHWQQEAENAQREAELWKSLAQRQDDTASVRRELRVVARERDEWKARFEGAKANAEYVHDSYGHPDDVDELKATVVRQAREITKLKGESE